MDPKADPYAQKERKPRQSSPLCKGLDQTRQKDIEKKKHKREKTERKIGVAGSDKRYRQKTWKK